MNQSTRITHPLLTLEREELQEVAREGAAGSLDGGLPLRLEGRRG